MDMTRRQFALSMAAAATTLRPLFVRSCFPNGCPRSIALGRMTWSHDPAAVTWDGTGWRGTPSLQYFNCTHGLGEIWLQGRREDHCLSQLKVSTPRKMAIERMVPVPLRTLSNLFKPPTATSPLLSH